MKILKKSEVVRLKQVEHINSEKTILAQVDCPFLVKLWVCFTSRERKAILILFPLCSPSLGILQKVLHLPRRDECLHVDGVHHGRRGFFTSSQSWTVLKRDDCLLCRPNHCGYWVPARLGYYLPRSEAGKPPHWHQRQHQDHRLRFCEESGRQVRADWDSPF